MSHYVFLHGVPDTHAIWRPLIKALDLPESGYTAPNLPGFGCEIPAGFDCTADSYLDWLGTVLENAYQAHGPLHVFGHDWGGILMGKAASLHPEKIATWTLINAVLHPNYKWHKMARLWQTPIVGEYVMMRANSARMAAMLRSDGVDPELAAEEGRGFDKHQKKAILRLYRSALKLKDTWGRSVKPMPTSGLVIFGEDDPYIGADFGKDYAKFHKAKYVGFEGVGHWSLATRPDLCAQAIKEHIQATL